MKDELPQVNTPPPKVDFDWQEFMPHLAQSDLSEDQKQVFIEAMWQIVLAFVDLGFEVGTPQESCGEALDLRAVLQRAMLTSDQQDKGDAA